MYSERQRQYHARPEQIAKRVCRTFRWRDENPIIYLLQCARRRAREKGLEFSITSRDVERVEVCPLLQVPLIYGGRGRKWAAASLDRLDPAKGYVPGNVWVISKRANAIKNSATFEELELLISGLRRKSGNFGH